MLTTKQAVLRRFWYALMPMTALDDEPTPAVGTRAVAKRVH